jgi:hypothetical protein
VVGFGSTQGSGWCPGSLLPTLDHMRFMMPFVPLMEQRAYFVAHLMYW